MNLKKTLKIARNIIESQYVDLCTVKEITTQRNEKTKINERIEVETLINVPCRLSFKNITPSKDTETTNNITHQIELFISPEIEIKAGSKIEIEHLGKKEIYKNSGQPRIYPTHQEIMLEICKDWS